MSQRVDRGLAEDGAVLLLGRQPLLLPGLHPGGEARTRDGLPGPLAPALQRRPPRVARRKPLRGGARLGPVRLGLPSLRRRMLGRVLRRSLQGAQGAVEFDPRLLARACAAADALGAVRPYSESMFEAIFAEGLPEIGEGESLQRAEAVGLSRDAFARELAWPGPERWLAETAAEAHSAGAFGVPTFVVDDRMFWGNDRLVLVRHFLKK